jgi:phosphate transport system protein
VTKHLEREIERLKRNLLAESALVEESVQKSVKAVKERDGRLARQVIDGDLEIDLMEVDIEEDCQKALALHQPVASDLRFIIAVLKINNDLERIGDLAVNIAERAEYLATLEPADIPFDFPGMAGKAQTMLRNSLDALVNLDADLAQQVIDADEEVDAINRHMYRQVQEGGRENPDQLEQLIHMLSISRHLERVADHATNIAEDVIYLIEGDIVRHRTEDYRELQSRDRDG